MSTDRPHSPARVHDFMRHRKLFLLVALALTAAGALTLAVRGLTLGIDFTGGTLLERGYPREVSAAEVRAVLGGPGLSKLELGGAVVQPLDRPGEVLIRTRALAPGEIRQVDEALAAAFGEGTEHRTELVGPVLGAELVRRALWALGVAAGLILAYVAVRFQFQFGVAAVAAIVHDVLVTAGVLSWLGTQVNTPFVAAMLTIVGYSLNDTIVVFDRIRENLGYRRRESLAELVNKSLHQSLARSLNTSLTTLLVVLCLYLFGGTTIRDFTLALLIGVTVGTYSSLFVATALWLSWRERREGRVRAARASA